MSIPNYKIKGYTSWQAMNQRCYNKNQKAYKNYGGRGIRVCDRWRGKTGFLNFIADMGERPTSVHTLDRIDNNGNYEASNCRWATRAEQNRNKRDNKLLTYGGVTKTVSEWGESLGSDVNLVNSRLRYGWDVDRALTTPPKRSSKKGVIWESSKRRWRAYLTYNKKRVLYRLFVTEEEAIAARINAEKQYKKKIAPKG